MLSEGHLEDVRNHYEDGYKIGKNDGFLEGRAKERHRIETIISLDLLVAQEVKNRLFDLINGGRRDDNQS